jgi:hypothetical protein
MRQRENVGEIFIGDRRPTLTKRLNDLRHMQCIPNQDGVGDQAQATRLVHDFLVIADAELALVGKEDSPRQAVPGIRPDSTGVARDALNLRRSGTSGCKSS